MSSIRIRQWMMVVGGLALAACGKQASLDDAAPGSGGQPDGGAMIDADTTAPDTFLDATPAAATKETAASFAFHSDDPTATFRCTLDGGAETDCTSPQVYTVLEGAHTFAVAAVDPAGNRDASPATFAWTVDTTPPDTTITQAPAAVDNTVDPTLAFTSEPDATFECSLDGAAFAPCASPDQLAPLADGPHTFDVRAIDAVGNVDPTPAHAAWTLDSSTPDTTIDAGPSGYEASRAVTFTFSSPNAGPGATFQCKLDGGAWIGCIAQESYAALTDGSHTFQVRVTNAAGTTDPTPATRTWIVDLTAPVVTITSGPNGPTDVATPTFAFTTDGTEATLQCVVDGGAPVACTSPFTTAALADGAHTFEVIATDLAGNAGTASRAFTVDTMAPTVTITGGPAGPTNDATPTFTFTTAGAPTSVQCAIDANAPVACTTTFTSATLADGAHTFTVRAADAAGNVGMASRAFTVDTVAPTVTITGGPNGLTNNKQPTFTFTTGGNPTTTQCRLGTGAFAACTSSFTPPAALADGSYTFDVQVIDAAGNSADATRAFTVDATPPTVVITGGPTGLTNDATPTFTFTTGGSPTSVQCAIDANAPAACTSSFTASTLADGTHTFTVTAADAAGNSASASRAFTVDATPPTVSITSGPTGLTNNKQPTFTFTTGGDPTTTQCRINSGAFAACAMLFTPGAPLADGSYTFDVQVIDAAGNSADATRDFTVDATPPTVTITGGPTGTSDSTPTFTFTTGGSPTTTQCRINSGAFAACTATFTPSTPLADGSYTFDVQVIDAAGNSADATRAFTVDQRITITGSVSPAAAATLAASTGGAACAGNACLVDPGTQVHLAISPAPGWSFSGWTGAAVGCTGTALAVDVTAGTTASSCTANFQALTVTFTATPDPITPLTSTHFAWSRTAAVDTAWCSLDGATAAPCVNATSQDYTYTTPGTHTFVLYGTDTAGTSSPSASFSWVQHVDDGHVVLMGHDFHGVVAPYTLGNEDVQQLLVGAIELAHPSATGDYQVLVYTGTASTQLGATEIANIKAAVANATGAVQFTDLASSSAAALTAALVGEHVLIVPDQIGGGGGALGTAWARALTDFVDRGGVLIVLDGLDASGNLDNTGYLLKNAGLMDFGGGFAASGTMAISPIENTPITRGLIGSYTLGDTSVEYASADGTEVVAGPSVGCTICGNTPMVVAHKTVHFLERFDYGAATLSSAWTAGTPNTIVVSTSAGRDETRGATGSAAVTTPDDIAWAWRNDAPVSLNSSVSAWVRFSDTGPGTTQYAALGVNASAGGTFAATVVETGGQAYLLNGTMAFGASPAFSPADGSSKDVTVQFGTWYRLTTTFVGTTLQTALYDAAGNQLATAQSITDSNTGRMGVAFGVSGGASLDSVTLVDVPQLDALFGTSTTSSANTGFVLLCPEGEVITGAAGGAASAIDRISSLHCGRVVRDTTIAAGYHVQSMPDATPGGGGTGGGPWDESCPAGQIVTGLVVTTAYVSPYTSLYGLQLECTQYTLTGAPGTLALVAGTTTPLTPAIGAGQAGLTYSSYTLTTLGGHLLTGLIGYAGPWPIYAGYTVVNGVRQIENRPWIAY